MRFCVGVGLCFVLSSLVMHKYLTVFVIIAKCYALIQQGLSVVGDEIDERDRIISGYPVRSREYPFQVYF